MTSSNTDSTKSASDRLLGALTRLEQAIGDIEKKLSTIASANDDKLKNLEEQLGSVKQQYSQLNEVTQQVANRLDENMEKLRKLAA
ncbi:MAG: hypothetical protein EYC62_00060 [Alphaproteobacteria bacterium]|nr:MAG: hypothetical protein EYC62_00060 [Alphaproteobacteria bacterium]